MAARFRACIRSAHGLGFTGATTELTTNRLPRQLPIDDCRLRVFETQSRNRLAIHQEEFDMSETRRRLWRRTAAVALLAVGIAGVATSLSQSPNGKWWLGYGNGADNSRYFASRQIDKS